MAKNKGRSTPRGTNDRHKPGRMVRLPETLARPLEVLVKRNVTSITQEVTRAVREYLERNHLWPEQPP